MFQELEREFSVLRLILQLVVVYLLPLFVLGPLEMLLETGNGPILQVAEFALAAIIYVGAGLAAWKLVPSSAREGQYVWLPLAALFGLGVCYDLATGHSGELPGYFYSGPGDPGGMPALVTIPAWGCCWYSATLRWCRGRRR